MAPRKQEVACGAGGTATAAHPPSVLDIQEFGPQLRTQDSAM